MFKHAKYFAIDFGKVAKSYGKLAAICNLENIPFQNGVFDMVLCTQVLEHLPEPKLVLIELNRTLKKGGKLWLTAPFFYEEHEKPYDFFRYTQFGLIYLLKSSGFILQELDWLEGFFGSFSYQLRVASHSIPIMPGAYGNTIIGWILILPMMIMKIFFYLTSHLFAWIEVIRDTKYKETGFCKNYTIIAIKG